MNKNSKSKKNKKSPKVSGLTGHEVVAAIFNVSVGWVSKVVTGKAKDTKGYKEELERYIQFQKAYIARRKQELGIDKNNES
jgi:nitroimidazol reductase NimA-like FMN-containing flavoprotein (pyridoxamine 5'-phosphate oxidase superfamily)